MEQNALHDSDLSLNKAEYDNEMAVEFDSLSQNEHFARTVVAAFVTQLNPTLEEISDIKTAVSEAVTNSIIHAYPNRIGKVRIWCGIEKDLVTIVVTDYGVGIENVKKAMEALYSSCPEMERSGMGFTFMSAFMDDLKVTSSLNEGTQVMMSKRIKNT